MCGMSAFSHLPDAEPMQIWEGVVGRVVEGERVTMALIELAAGCVIPEHRHHNEQLGVCIAGSLRFRIGDETRDVGPGDGWRILGDIPHQVETGPDGAVGAGVVRPCALRLGRPRTAPVSRSGPVLTAGAPTDRVTAGMAAAAPNLVAGWVRGEAPVALGSTHGVSGGLHFT